jgi:hypothetical protein
MTELGEAPRSNMREDEIFAAEATHVEIDGLDAKAAIKIIEADRKAGRFGRASGFVFIIAGLILVIFGFVGGTTFAVSLVGLSVNLNDAAPGIIFAVVGLVLYWIHRPEVTIISKRK